ncbi:MAG: tetratricopeptide repeat protein, partial [Methanomassiliicoccales archaeon]|nr:tetratricopeptide repeat protein [Methanomassiliicoccales archaeon]
LLLNLMAASGASRGKRDVTAFLDQEVGSSLTEAERETLEALSIHRQPVPVEALTARERDALPSLRRKGLLIEDEDGTWTHELLTSHFHSRLSGDRSRELHKSAAEFYLGQMEADYWMEGLYHAVEAQDSGQVLKALSLDGEGLALAFPEEMEALLQKIRRWDGLVGSRVDVLILLALAQEELGHETPALETYDEILRLLDGSSDVRIALALERKARLQAEARRWSQAFESHERALRLYQSSGDRAGEAGEWMSLGSAHRRRGDLAKARACFQSAWEVAERLGDLRVMAAALNNLALVEWDDGFPSRSEPLMERSVALAHQAEDLVGEARALQNLSSLLRAQAREGEALQRMAEAEAAFHRAGEVEECRKATVARAELFADLGREAEGIELLRKALAEPAHRTPFRRKGRGAQGEGRLREGLVRQLRECGRLDEAEQEALALEALAVRLDDARMAARAKIELDAILEDEGKEGGAVEALESAREELARVGDAAGLAVVHLRLGELARKVGDRGKALRELREAARQASLSGSLLAEASTLEDLGLALEEREERESTLRRAYEAYSQIRRRADAERVHAYLDEG